MSPTKTAASLKKQAKQGARTGTAEIADALLAIGRAMTQPKMHQSICRRAGVDLDRSGVAVLYKLAIEGDDIHLTVLADRLGIDSPAVTRKVQQLERLGLVSRRRDEMDARAMRISITAEGRRDIERILAARLEWFDELLASWSVEDRLSFSKLLSMFAATVQIGGSGDVAR
jgi:DNA-binding MarR family transcriptional regulator